MASSACAEPCHAPQYLPELLSGDCQNEVHPFAGVECHQSVQAVCDAVDIHLTRFVFSECASVDQSERIGVPISEKTLLWLQRRLLHATLF